MSNKRIVIGTEFNNKTEPPESGYFFNRKLGSADRAVLRDRPEVKGHHRVDPAGSLTDLLLSAGSRVFLATPLAGTDGRQVRVLAKGTSCLECDSAAFNGEHRQIKFLAGGSAVLLSEGGLWFVLSSTKAVFI